MESDLLLWSVSMETGGAEKAEGLAVPLQVFSAEIPTAFDFHRSF